MSVATKMKLQEQTALYLLKAPPALQGLFTGYNVKTKLTGKAEIGQLVIFAENRKTLDEMIPKVMSKLTKDALLWIAYPKKTGTVPSDITRDSGWDTAFAAGYEPVTQVAVNEDWSALRFRSSEAIGPKLRDIPMEARQIEGVDFVKRTVTFPGDVLDALKPHKDLLALLNGMSFSHKKEYAEAIVTAKKPETRARRIEKMIETLRKYKTEKEKKKKQ
ncbi:MAG TPA: YdeI/OmpD-associated family protein [Flavipsychrobacter sp.]